MGLRPGQKLQDIEVDAVFIGSCTNGRIEDLREVEKIVKGKKVKSGIRAMVVPGSGLVKKQAEEEGIASTLKEAGFDWRMPGCSMCLGMNPDQLLPEVRCDATSYSNFEDVKVVGDDPFNESGNGSSCSNYWPIDGCKRYL